MANIDSEIPKNTIERIYDHLTNIAEAIERVVELVDTITDNARLTEDTNTQEEINTEGLNTEEIEEGQIIEPIIKEKQTYREISLFYYPNKDPEEQRRRLHHAVDYHVNLEISQLTNGHKHANQQ